MKAAVVHSFEEPPRLGDFDEPVPGEDEVTVRVEAAALSQLARSQAAGTHYSSVNTPFVPGADGVGYTEDGQRVYFAFPRSPWGSMGEYTAVKKSHVVALPVHVDAVRFAALANPAMSSLAALVHRAQFIKGESVLINGANGVSGRLAIQIARILGARRIVVTARNARSRNELLELGADAFIALANGRESVVADVKTHLLVGFDVVLDYLWGTPAEWVLEGIAAAAKRPKPNRVRFITIGASAGAATALPSAWLRSGPLELLGSGLGSVPTPNLVGAVAQVADILRSHTLPIDAVGVPIHGVSTQWTSGAKSRVVFTF